MRDFRSLEQKIRQVIIDESNRNTEIRRRVANVGRPEHNVKDETSKLAKQGEIKTKIIDEAADDDKDKKVKKDTEMDDIEAKEIKGGKTEVDTEPKTDDSTEDSTAEDKKAKKAKSDENKKIGAKGIKEEKGLNMDTKFKFNLPQGLIDTVRDVVEASKTCSKCGKSPCQCDGDPKKVEEELKGGQKKLDKNHNGKLDAQDFKILRGKKMEEEVEQIDEVGNRINKQKKDAAISAIGAKNRDKHYLTRMNPSQADKIRGREVTKGKDRKWYGVRSQDHMDEEVKFSEAELARIEEIAKGL